MGGRQLRLALKMKLPLSLNTPSPVTSPMAGKEKKTFSPSGLRPTLPRQRGIDPERRAASRGQPRRAEPGSRQPPQPASNWAQRGAGKDCLLASTRLILPEPRCPREADVDLSGWPHWWGGALQGYPMQEEPDVPHSPPPLPIPNTHFPCWTGTIAKA